MSGAADGFRVQSRKDFALALGTFCRDCGAEPPKLPARASLFIGAGTLGTLLPAQQCRTYLGTYL